MADVKHHFNTLAIHAGEQPDATGSLHVPVYHNISYAFLNSEHAANLFGLKEFGNIYTRLMNPTTGALQTRFAALEGAAGAVATSSGHAAQLTAFFNLLQPGDELVAAKELYGGTVTQLSKSFHQFGWKTRFASVHDLDTIRSLITEKTKGIYVESYSNPSGAIADIEALAAIAHDAGIPLIVDNTIPTPALLRPIEYGADIVVASLTKYLTGNSTVLGGIIADSGGFDWTQNDKFPLLTAPDPSYHGVQFAQTFEALGFTVRTIAVGLRDLGTTLSPHNAFTTLTALETVSLRVERHVENAAAVAAFLHEHPKVESVLHPDYESSEINKKLRKRYFPNGVPSVFSIKLKGGVAAGEALVHGVTLFSHVANLGDARSLIIHPATTTHSQLSDEQKKDAFASPGIIRLSIGLEDKDDIIADLEQALGKV